MKKLSKEFKSLLRKTEQIEFEKSKYEKAARIERPQREPRLDKDDLFTLLAVAITILPVFALFALIITG